MPFIHPDVLDDICAVIASTATTLCLCSAEPGTFNEATQGAADDPAGFMLATATITGEITVADDVDGKKATLAEQTGITPTNDGDATHYAICTGSTLLMAGPLASTYAITDADTLTFFALKLLNQRTPTS